MSVDRLDEIGLDEGRFGLTFRTFALARPLRLYASNLSI